MEIIGKTQSQLLFSKIVEFDGIYKINAEVKEIIKI
jgi:hypothetical protein